MERPGLSSRLRPPACHAGKALYPRAGNADHDSPLSTPTARSKEPPPQMPDEDLEEELIEDEEPEVPEDLDEEDLEVVDVEDEDEVLAVVDDDLVEVVPAIDTKAVARDEDEEDDDDDDEDSDDVEASLDVILKERMVVADDDDDEEDDTPDGDERGESPLKVLPKQPGEFVCQSCFLVKHPSQLSDPKRQFCRDCV
ncbi:MAG: DUF4193 family protein [Acidimicrobiales bacterium]